MNDYEENPEDIEDLQDLVKKQIILLDYPIISF